MVICESCMPRGLLHSNWWPLANLSSVSTNYRLDNNVFLIHNLILEKNQRSQLLEVTQECPFVWSCRTISSWRNAQKSRALSRSSWSQIPLTPMESAYCFNPGEVWMSYFQRKQRRKLCREGKIVSACSQWASSLLRKTKYWDFWGKTFYPPYYISQQMALKFYILLRKHWI